MLVIRLLFGLAVGIWFGLALNLPWYGVTGFAILLGLTGMATPKKCDCECDCEEEATNTRSQA